MSVLGGKSTFVIKILVRAREYRSKPIFSKNTSSKKIAASLSDKAIWKFYEFKNIPLNWSMIKLEIGFHRASNST
jgi:hypothetical protein